ncbi:hypothetical protein AVEN_228278-1 [Araneus ventricosus]|uniref:Uncharacterized protein n=1 Tax=Araneus ventricosus TaxID=182803 RepID=A0A4Y2ED97_ARAVE|nr:hypothetical protein AVEN_228278-1 [Araneus ventricosus]
MYVCLFAWINVPFLKRHKGYFGTDLVIENRGQFVRMSLEPPPSTKFQASRWTYDADGFSVSRPRTRGIFDELGLCPSGLGAETPSQGHRVP